MKKIKSLILRNRWSILILLIAAAVFMLARGLAMPEAEPDIKAGDYVEYESGKVKEILSDSAEPDAISDGGYRGAQMLLVEVTSGQYTGKTLLVDYQLNPLLTSPPVSVGDSISLTISTYASGDVRATVYEYNRIGPLAVVVALFLLATVAVGGKTGAKSLLALVITLMCLLLVLIPGLLKGWPTLLSVFLTCVFITVVSLTLLGGVQKKNVCAMLGTIAGVAFAMLFGLLAQRLTRIDGLRLSDMEPLLQYRQTGHAIGLRGLLVAGILISALGAVMDVAMSISSALCEVKAANPLLNRRALFRSGMNIGRDMVGTMTNTLILAFFGSDFTLIIYLYTLGLSKYQLLTSAFFATEVISGISSSIGLILSIPLTALISAVVLSGKKQGKK